MRELDLSETGITDDFLETLAPLQNLETLTLCGNDVSDTGLTHLAGLNRLRSLAVKGTQVTAKGAAALRKAIPGLSISGVRR